MSSMTSRTLAVLLVAAVGVTAAPGTLYDDGTVVASGGSLSLGGRSEPRCFFFEALGERFAHVAIHSGWLGAENRRDFGSGVEM